MSFRLTPLSPAGKTLDALIQPLLPALRERAEQADLENTICAANYGDLQTTGIAAAFVPESLGGLGLESMHDWIVAISRLASGDGSTAIAISMHLSTTRAMAARYAAAEPGSDEAIRLAGLLRGVADGQTLICSTTTESGNDNLHPHTEAVRAADGQSWIVSGRKHFVTMSPLATHVALNLRMRDTQGDHIANVLVPMDSEGIHPGNDWNALGMRASGSQSLEFRNCPAPLEALRVIGPWGRWSIPVLLNRTLANVPLVAAFLGIAESAYEIAREGARRPGGTPRAGVRHAIAEMEISLATSQSLMERMGRRLDAVLPHGTSLDWESAHELMKDYQSVKWVVNRAAIDIVSKAMDLAGGRGYVSSNPLTRLYRDVRAGPFMQPHSPIDAHEYIGRVSLGEYPKS